MRMILTAALVTAALAPWAMAADPPGDTVLVKRGDVTVTVDDVNASLSKLNDEQRFAHRASVESLTKGVSNIYVTRMLAKEAAASGIEQDPEVKKRLQLQNEATLAQIYMERFEKAIKTPDYEARAREVYNASPDRYKLPERVKFRHILVDFQGRTQEEARRRAEEARKLLLNKEAFGRVARQYSNDPTFRGNDGTLGPAPFTALIKELADALKTAPLNQVSDIIESKDGYHIVIPLERLAATTIPFEAAKKGLIDEEQLKFRRAAIDKKLGEITASKDVTLYTDNIALMKTQVDRELLRKLHEEEAQKQAQKLPAK